MNPIDHVLGGPALVGKKTILAVVAYTTLSILQSLGVVGTATGDKATTAGAILTALILSFGAMGLLAKIDRIATAVENPPILSAIDYALGGQVLVGMKTMLAVVAYTALSILQSLGVVGTATGDKATTAGAILTALILSFGAMGLLAKIDRIATAVENPPILSPIEKVLNAQAVLAVIAYTTLSILQSLGVVGTATGDKATTAGAILTALILSFGAMGLLAKIDRILRRSQLQGRQEREREVERRPAPKEVMETRGTRIDARQKIFVVHGHDEGPQDAVARFLEGMGFEPVVLHQQPNKGRSIITKFREETADVKFAVVLMTPDDYGGKAGATPRARARQNVVFELGFFFGAFGPERVAPLVKGDVEKPSDFEGVAYISLDDKDWQKQLGRELKAAGFEIDWNKVMR